MYSTCFSLSANSSSVKDSSKSASDGSTELSLSLPLSSLLLISPDGQRALYFKRLEETKGSSLTQLSLSPSTTGNPCKCTGLASCFFFFPSVFHSSIPAAMIAASSFSRELQFEFYRHASQQSLSYPPHPTFLSRERQSTAIMVEHTKHTQQYQHPVASPSLSSLIPSPSPRPVSHDRESRPALHCVMPTALHRAQAQSFLGRGMWMWMAEEVGDEDWSGVCC